jgi:hypothetical protein
VTDLELLFLVLACIYLFECACWIPRGSIAFLSWLCLTGAPRFNPFRIFHRLGLVGWRIAHPAALFGNQRGGFGFASPFPPLGSVLVCSQFPLSLSSEFVLGYVSTSINPGARPTQTALLFKYDQIKKVTVEGKKLFVNGKAVVRGTSPTQVLWISKLLTELSKLAPEQREKRIRAVIKETLETKGVEERWQEFEQKTDLLSMVTNMLFFYLFVFVPMWIWRFGLERTWPALLLGLYGLTTTTAILFRGIHKHYYPEAGDDRFMHFLTILFSPATTIRARDVLSRPLLPTSHPLAIARVFCRDDRFRELAGRVLRDIRFPALPVCPNADPAMGSAEKFFRTALQQEVEQFLRSKKVNLEKLLAAPAPADETCRTYCPRCLAQFTTTEGCCADCGGLAVLALDARIAKS